MKNESSHSARLWENLRSLLAGLGTQTVVRRIPELAWGRAVAVRVGEMPGVLVRRLSNREWETEPEVREWAAMPLPDTHTLNAVPTTKVSGSATESLAEPETVTLSVRFAPAQTHEAPVQMRGRGEVTALALPSPQTLRVGSLPVPRPALGRSRSDPRVPLTVLPRRVRSGLAVAARLPLPRRCQAPPPGMSVREGFPVEWRRLAMSAKLPPEEVSLLGVYPGIPIAALQKLVVSPTGETLELWLKPDALGKPGLTLRTLVIGREITTGKRLQAIL